MMDLKIRELSESFSKLLPHDNEKFTLSDIESSGIPFLVRKRIVQIAHEHFKQSVPVPESEWADLQSQKARELWDNYLEGMKEVLEMPPENADTIIYEATDFVLRLAVQPRKTIVKKLFDNKSSITKEELSGMMDQFVSNRHLIFALNRYMVKKQKESLDAEKARLIINTVDQKLTETYNSLDWMKAVKPIFNVAGVNVPSELIRIFFEEKGLNRVSRKFDMIEEDLTETDFVEVMSSADLLDLKGFEEEQQALFADEEEISEESEATGSPEREDLSAQKDKKESNLSDTFLKSDDTEKIEEAKDEADTTSEGFSEDKEQFDSNLLQLFSEDEEGDSGQQEQEKLQSESEEPHIETESEPDEEEESEQKVSHLTNETESEDINKPEQETKVPETIAADDTEEREINDLDKDDVQKVEDSNLDDKEMPREEELIPEEDEEEEPEGWEDVQNIEEGSLLDRFRDEEYESGSAEQTEEKPDKQESSEPTTIYEELNLAPFEEGNEPDEKKLSFEEGVMEGNEEPEAEPGIDDLPFEPNDRAADNIDEEYSEKTDAEITPTAQSRDEYEDPVPEDDKDEEDSEVPMWKSFLERENPDDEPSFYFDDGFEESSSEVTSPDSGEDEINENPIITQSADASKINDEIERISKWLAADRDRFLHEIFNGSKLAWEQALIDLTVFDDWKSASRYLENEIFNRNQIDIYSEIAVDFTDYLHSYFMEYKS